MNDSALESVCAVSSAASIVIILSGPRRGNNEILSQETYRIVLDPDESVHILEPDAELEADFHATLHRADDSYEIEVAPEHNVWVNGQQVKENQLLQTGDMLEIGHKGPLLRFRMCADGQTHTKNLTELIADCFNGAQVDSGTRLGRISRFFSNINRDLITQTTLWFRFWVLIITTLLVISIVFLIMQNMKLQQRVATEDVRIESIEDVLEERDTNRLSQQDLLQLKADVESQLTGTFERLEQLETVKLSQQDLLQLKADVESQLAGTFERLEQLETVKLSQQDLLQLKADVESQLAGTFDRLEQLETVPGKASKIIATATPSVIFILGAYGFIDPETGLLFRYIESADGLTTRYSFEEEARIMEVPFTGTAFVVSNSGLLLTNRHVMEPWRNESETNIVQGRQLLPVILRVYAYYPDATEPLKVTALHASDYLDLAILRTREKITGVIPLEFQPRVPEPGDEVLLLGYPTGIRALVARVSTEFIESITLDNAMDYSTVANNLSEAGYIKPLATRGIIGQITNKFIVYDAETTFGGSGGPVLDNNGKVIAVNAALIPEFGGSNMGVPAQHAQYFLSQPPVWKKIESRE